MDESNDQEQNNASPEDLLAAFLESREAFKNVRAKIKAKEARFPEILQALGQLAVESTMLESELTTTLIELIISPTEPKATIKPAVVNVFIQQRRSFPALADLVKKLFDAYIKDKEKREPFHNAVNEAKELMAKRGQRIHGLWNLDYATDKVAYFANKATRESVDPEEIVAISKDIQHCKDRIYKTFVEAFKGLGTP